MRTHSQHSHQSNVINVVMRANIPVTTRVAIGAGALQSIPNLLTQSNAGKQVLLLTQPPVAERWAGPVFESLSTQGFHPTTMELPDGEACKSAEVLIGVWQRLQELRFTRTDSILAVGGGALTDLAGFAASTYLRGINLLLAPTTLLAQVDASIGGKTGINLPAGKNLAGAFYFPTAVVCDSQPLATLPSREIRSGLGEIIKYALIESSIIAETEYRGGPRSFFNVLTESLGGEFDAQDPAIDNIIAASVRMKLAVVAKDPYEGRLRRALNLGHTLGHAVEKVSSYSVSHGEAVAIGLVFACRLSASFGRFDGGDLEKVLKLLQSAHLPTEVPLNMRTDELLDAMAFDKKKAGEQIKFVLPVKPLGAVDLDASLTIDQLSGVLR